MKSQLLQISTVLVGVGFFVPVFSQNNTQKTLEGIVLNSKLDIANIHILNTSQKKYTITDNAGRFEIDVALKDTLKIKGILFIEETIVVTNDILNKKIVEINLKEQIYNLEEVIISKHDLTGDLEKDLDNIPLKKIWSGADVGLPVSKGKPEEKIVPIGAALGYGLITNIQLEALQKHLNGYYKRLKNKRKWEADDVLAKEIVLFYKKSFFKNTFKIPEEKLYQFIYYCILTDKNVKSNFKNQNHELILQTFKEKSNTFLKD